jgi:hypothetical protein
VLKVYDYFVAESKRGARFYSWKYESKPMEFHENNKTFKKDSLDHFDKDVIKNVIYG